LRFGGIIRLDCNRLLLWLLIVVVGIVKSGNITGGHKRRKEWTPEKKRVPEEWAAEKRVSEKRVSEEWTSEKERVFEEVMTAWEAGGPEAVRKENSVSACPAWVKGENRS
jgi:hypothetical protein